MFVENVELYVVISEKKIFTDYEHGQVYITKHRFVIRKNYLQCETLVEHRASGASKGDTRRVEQ